MTAYPWSAMLTALTNYQVDKLKVLADSLASSSSKAEQRILEHRFFLWFFSCMKYFVMALAQYHVNRIYFILGCLFCFYSLVETLSPLLYIHADNFFLSSRLSWKSVNFFVCQCTMMKKTTTLWLLWHYELLNL